jgi:hypothetical protein
MSVSNGQLANQTTFNNAFWSKDTATTGTGTYRVANTDTASGDPVDNIQREFNSVTSFVGMSLDQAATGLPSWSSDNIGSANDDVKTRVESIQSQVETNQTNIETLQTASVKWTKYTKSYTDFSAAATSSEISLVTLNAAEVVQGIVIKHSAVFGGGSITSYEVSVGPSGDATKYVDSFDADQTVASSAFLNTTLMELEDFASTSVLAVQAVTVGDDLDQAASGSIDIWVLSSTLP